MELQINTYGRVFVGSFYGSLVVLEEEFMKMGKRLYENAILF